MTDDVDGVSGFGCGAAYLDGKSGCGVGSEPDRVRGLSRVLGAGSHVRIGFGRFHVDGETEVIC